MLRTHTFHVCHDARVHTGRQIQIEIRIIGLVPINGAIWSTFRGITAHDEMASGTGLSRQWCVIHRLTAVIVPPCTAVTVENWLSTEMRKWVISLAHDLRGGRKVEVERFLPNWWSGLWHIWIFISIYTGKFWLFLEQNIQAFSK